MENKVLKVGESLSTVCSSQTFLLKEKTVIRFFRFSSRIKMTLCQQENHNARLYDGKSCMETLGASVFSHCRVVLDCLFPRGSNSGSSVCHHRNFLFRSV